MGLSGGDTRLAYDAAEVPTCLAGREECPLWGCVPARMSSALSVAMFDPSSCFGRSLVPQRSISTEVVELLVPPVKASA